MDGGLAVYQGTCNSMTEIGCDDDASNNGLMPMLDLSGLVIGQTLYIRVWGNSGSTGTFQLCVYDGGGCATAPAPMLLYGDIQPCIYDTVTFSIDPINGATAYHWVLGGTGQIIAGGLGADTFFTVLWNSTGYGNINVASINGCGWSSLLNQDVFVCSPSSQPVVVASQSTICSGSLDTLTIVSGTLGACSRWVWYKDICGGTPIGFGDSLFVSPVSTSSFYVRAEDNSGCGTSNCSVQTIVVDQLPSPIINGDTVICQGNSIELDAGAGYQNYLWSNGTTGQTITILEGGLYNVTVMDVNDCIGTASILILSDSLADPIIAGNTLICNGDSSLLDAGFSISYLLCIALKKLSIKESILPSSKAFAAS